MQLFAVVLVSVLGLLATAVVVVWFALPGWVLARVEAEAQKRGLALSQCQLQLGYPTLILTECRFEAEAAKQLTGTLDSLSVTLQGTDPSALAVQGAHLVVRGMPEFDHLFEQRKRILEHSVPLEVTDSTLAVYLSDTPTPTVQLSKLQYTLPSGDFQGNVDVAGLLRGQVNKNAELIQLSLAPVQDANSKLEIRIGQATALGELRLEFQRFALAQLAQAGVSIPPELQAVTVDGQLYAQIPIGLNPAPAKGDLRLTLHGLNFPVPRELAGLVYGTPAEVTTNFNLDRSFTKADLKKTSFKVGALEMHGQGKLALNGFALDFELNLNGRLSCDAIVRSAVLAHAGSELSRIAGIIAKRALKGSVEVIARVTGSTSALDKVTVIKTVGIGCGLKPFPLDGFPLDGLPSPDDVLGKLKGLPDELDKRLPKAPDPDTEEPVLKLPKLPTLPGLPKKGVKDESKEDGKGPPKPATEPRQKR